MPNYEYRCGNCGKISSVYSSVNDAEKTLPCQHCSEQAERIISRPSVHLSKASKIEKLDPKYDKMIDKAMRNTQNAEPDRILKKMKPFSED